MPVYCISGANRGLGLEFVRQLAASDPTNLILATVRNASTDTTALKAVASPATHILHCDTSSLDSIRVFSSSVARLLGSQGQKIDFLLNVAGINFAPQLSSLSITPDALEANMRTNVVGPAKVVEFLVGKDTLSPAVRILNMTSGLGSMAKSGAIVPRKCMVYSISKAGLNMLTVHQAEDLKQKVPGVVVVAVDPGLVLVSVVFVNLTP